MFCTDNMSNKDTFFKIKIFPPAQSCTAGPSPAVKQHHLVDGWGKRLLSPSGCSKNVVH